MHIYVPKHDVRSCVYLKDTYLASIINSINTTKDNLGYFNCCLVSLVFLSNILNLSIMYCKKKEKARITSGHNISFRPIPN